MNRQLVYRHNANIFVVEAKSSITPLVHEVQETPLYQDAYKIYNIGRVDVNVALLYGTDEEWHKVAEECGVKPGQTVIIDNAEKFFFASGVRITNNTKERAIVHCTKGDGRYSMVAIKEPGVFDEEYSRNLKKTYSVGIKYVPYVTQKYRGILDTFWPSNKLNTWEEILIKLEPLIKDNILKCLSPTIRHYMKNLKRRLKKLSKNYARRSETQKSYIGITETVLQFEKKLTFTEKNEDNYKTRTNMLLLPLYSNFVFLKVTFYALGIVDALDIGLSFTEQSHIQDLLKETIDNATKYIKDMYDYQVQHAYNTSHPEDLFNSMMNVRSYVGVHGTEYIGIWQNVLRNPYRGVIVTDEVTTYSNFFGRQTPSLIREATCQKMCLPLTPRYLGFLYNALELIEVYLWRRGPSASFKIGGMKLLYADWSSFIIGTVTSESEKVKFNGAHITKLEVSGTGLVDSCMFHMSDGRQLFFGTTEKDSEKEIFELTGHRIVSIFLSSDHHGLDGQAANIAVAYRLNCMYQ